MSDCIIRIVNGYGYLPIITFNENEYYRGSFKKTISEAAAVLEEMLPRVKKENGL